MAGYLGHSAYPHVSAIENCYATGRVAGQCYAGGMVGNVGSKAVLNKCYSAVDVNSSCSHAGGLVGKIRAPFVMEECYSVDDSEKEVTAHLNAWRHAKYNRN